MDRRSARAKGGSRPYSYIYHLRGAGWEGGVSGIAAVAVQWEEVYGMLLCQLKGTPSKGASRVLSVEMDF